MYIYSNIFKQYTRIVMCRSAMFFDAKGVLGRRAFAKTACSGVHFLQVRHSQQLYPNYIISEFLSQFLSQLSLSIPCKSPKKTYAMVVAPIPDHLGCPTATSSGDSTCKAESGLGDHDSSSVLMFWMPILSKNIKKKYDVLQLV